MSNLIRVGDKVLIRVEGVPEICNAEITKVEGELVSFKTHEGKHGTVRRQGVEVTERVFLLNDQVQIKNSPDICARIVSPVYKDIVRIELPVDSGAHYSVSVDAIEHKLMRALDAFIIIERALQKYNGSLVREALAVLREEVVR